MWPNLASTARRSWPPSPASRGSRRRCRRPDRGSRRSTPGRRRTWRPPPSSSMISSLAPVVLHDPGAAHALAEVLVGGDDQHLLDAFVGVGHGGGGAERVVGLVLDHRPHGEAASPSRAPPSRGIWAQQLRGHAGAGLVARPEIVAETLDDVVARHADVGGAVVHQLRASSATTPAARGVRAASRRDGRPDRSAGGTARRCRRPGGPASGPTVHSPPLSRAGGRRRGTARRRRARPNVPSARNGPKGTWVRLPARPMAISTRPVTAPAKKPSSRPTGTSARFSQPRAMPSSGARRTSPSPRPPRTDEVDGQHDHQRHERADERTEQAVRLVGDERGNDEQGSGCCRGQRGDLPRQPVGAQVDPREDDEPEPDHGVRRERPTAELRGERAEHRRGQEPDDELFAADRDDVAPHQHPVGGRRQRHAECEAEEDGDGDQHDAPDVTPARFLSAHEPTRRSRADRNDRRGRPPGVAGPA